MIRPEFDVRQIKSHDVLVFDYDGTLSDFVPDPRQAIVPEEVVQALTKLAARQPVIVITGREVEEVDRFLSPLKLPVSGAHGRKFRATGTSEIDAPPLPPMPTQLREEAERIVSRYPGSFIEVKDEFAFGFHVRPMAAEARQPALDEYSNAMQGLIQGSGYKLQPGSMVIEICPAGFDKGQALGRFLTMPDYAGRRVVYFGDDLTDEYAFRALSGESFGVLVGPRALNPETQTAAVYSLPNPTAMREALAKIAG